MGAHRGNVLQLFLKQGLKMALLGLALGLVLAFAFARILASLLFNVKPTDVIAFAGAASLLSLAVLVANYVPARRAMRVDPMIALRNQ